MNVSIKWKERKMRDAENVILLFAGCLLPCSLSTLTLFSNMKCDRTNSLLYLHFSISCIFVYESFSFAFRILRHFVYIGVRALIHTSHIIKHTHTHTHSLASMHFFYIDMNMRVGNISRFV